LRSLRSNLPYPRPRMERVRVRGNLDQKSEAGGSGGEMESEPISHNFS